MNKVVLNAERQLIDLACNGESKAINHLISLYQTKIFLQIRAQVADQSIAKDLMQEVNIKIFRYLGHFKHNSTFATWLYKVTQNTIKNYFRDKKNELELEYCISLDREDLHSSPEACLIGTQLLQQMVEVFKAMPEELRHCFHLHAIDGLSYEAIAKHQDCPVGTVRSRIHRAKSILKENLKLPPS